MEMTRLEKRLVNRKEKGSANIKMIRKAFEIINPDQVRNALEIGCGVGYVSSFLAEAYGIQVVGTDFDPQQIKSARQLHGENDRLQFRQADAAQLPFPSQSFDLVISQYVFHHIPAWTEAVEEIARVLRPDRFLIWLDLTLPPLVRNILQPLGKFYGIYSREDVRKEMEQHHLHELFFERTFQWFFPGLHLVLQKHKTGIN